MNRSIKILVTVLIAGMVLFMGYTQIRNWHRAGLDRVLSQEKAACGEEIAALNADLESVRNELMQLKDTGEYERRLSEIFGEKTDYLSFGNDSNCNDLLLQVRTFLNYMDQQDYMGSYKGSGGSQKLIGDVTKQLAQSTPMLSGEMDDLIRLIQNVTHLYRHLGKERVDIIKNLLKSESDIIETVMAIFYAYMTSGDRCPDKIIQLLSPEKSYRYAGYFLNTLAGRSYLLRRDSKMRVLISYYAVLTIDMANDEILNSYGIDIRPFIDHSFYEIGNQKGLNYQGPYLEKLAGLRVKYGM
ncbi:MAG: hypothetical protein JRI64_02115 [Deltaproteobacteria bacterium]|nr:hypothetical protein [Deltaproteobacteria bacterium]